jgi:hypothetical protein
MGRKLDAVLAKGLPERDKKNANKVNLWAFGWMGTLMLNAILFEAYESTNLILFSLILLGHIGCGIMLVLSYRKFLSELDEMERKVQLEALALAVGFAILVFSTGGILSSIDVVPSPSASILIAVISLTYMAGLIVGRIRLS